jgi:hypothetical protein
MTLMLIYMNLSNIFHVYKKTSSSKRVREIARSKKFKNCHHESAFLPRINSIIAHSGPAGEEWGAEQCCTLDRHISSLY